MKTLFIKTFALICMYVIQTAAFSQAMTQQIKASDPNIQYMGRIDNSKPDNVVFAWSGVSIKAKFQGTAIDAVIKNGPYLLYENGQLPKPTDANFNEKTNFFYVIIDGTIQPTKLKLIPSQSAATTYQLARGLTDGVHTIELVKLTEAHCGKVEFQGFMLESGKTLLTPDPLPSRKVEFIGNSITCGYGNEVSYTAAQLTTIQGFNAVNENNYMAWGYITARNLTAQYSCVAISGRGLYRNNFGTTTSTIPLVYDNIIEDNASPAWNHTRYTPNVIVINLGTNDFSAETAEIFGWGGPGWLVDRTTFVNTYINFVNKLRGYYPDATIICAVGTLMSDWYPENKQHWTRIREHVKAVRDNFNSKGDNKVHYFEMNPQDAPYGEDWHPTTATQIKMATAITKFITDLPLTIWGNQTQLTEPASSKSTLIVTQENISISSENQISTVELIDMQGAIISTKKVQSNSVTMSVASLPKGVYLARITYTGEQAETVKFVK